MPGDDYMLELAKAELLDVLEQNDVVSSMLWHTLCVQGSEPDHDLNDVADELIRVGSAWRLSKGLSTALSEWVIGPPQD